MDAFVARQGIYGNNKAAYLNRGLMPPKKGPPYVTTSVSGITAEDWDAFKARADREQISYRESLSRAVNDLATAVRRGDAVDWKAIKVAPSRPVRIGEDLREEVRSLAAEFGYRQNVILATAMHAWANKKAE
ncbi:hypothetical protein SAE02_63130 [Skermanella aerolata]|uniref:Uncharacterized protein n=1 Tax=Skermanella aerolata TaxID=393310 RepID=A0A512E0E9_9PROT|nr:hypothetical protein N826_39350 [Skermanella aerolata KACC 11604]GEO42165.1 hypothetical protein SAE02_63130 [Skermanella aerolata]